MTPTGEDLQPNELRLNRKGAASIPSVKVTTGPSTKCRDTGHIRFGSNPRRGIEGHHKVRRSDLAPRHNNLSEPLRTAPRSSGYSYTSPRTPSDALPSSLSRTIKREAASPDLRRLTPPKRPRQNYVTQRRSPSLDSGLAKRPPNENSITVDLPFDCWKGNVGYKKARHNWLGVERRRVEREHKVRLGALQYLDRQVVFFCKAERPPEAKCMHFLMYHLKC